MHNQLTMEIFDRLLKFGIESDRLMFCQRLRSIWEEENICCQSYPTITNQLLDLYKLHHLVQERQGYLEITTNRGWKEISNILGFGDSGSAAYSVKRNYVRLGLLAYECRFDRAGLDPRSVIEMAEMPHTVKKRKRGNNSTSTTRKIVKVHKQHLPTLYDSDETKNSLPLSIDNNSCRSQDSSYSFRCLPQQMPINDFQYFAYILRAGWLADSNKYLDTLLVWLSDSRTASYFNLKSLPGLFNAITEQYVACLYELYEHSFLQPSTTNDCYMNWFLQFKLRINDSVIGPQANQQRLETLFYGTHRYVLKQLITKQDHTPSIDRSHSIMIRSACLATIIRNLSFIEENEYLANDRCLVDILVRILNCHHETMHEIFDSNIYSHQQSDLFNNNPLTSSNDCNQQQQHLMYLLDNTFVTLANLSSFLELRYCHFITRSRLIHTIIHWISCSLSFTNDLFISMDMEEQMNTKKIEQISISPREISLQIFAKLCTNEVNVDFILLDLNYEELISFNHTLLSLMNSSNQEDINREYCLLIICSLCKRNRLLVEFFSSQINCIELIFNYLEFYEYNQQQHLIATLTSYYNASSSSSSSSSVATTTTIPMNHSADMMIDSCTQLLLLFATIKENNCLKLFEYRLLDMSSSIYFEQRILKAFADILYRIQS
ncbi:hypothetical protein I4U23_014375 [Adineta vaga]|nr:hypothetical protein I4U23_014375 [Adineta vaga]